MQLFVASFPSAVINHVNYVEFIGIFVNYEILLIVQCRDVYSDSLF